ncbi:NADase-type glycan-binding domain-containing protein [Umezawaea beigongshangensis]|uniref:NADase-type glycan-binding domain-containing protein n=1 Tax=Umezawaea beigongshangensis TaxID=2780383 RepID=UPI0018F239ED|nr:zinc-ribbon domain-containing protein [Umezawaea beigongshangensis]
MGVRACPVCGSPNGETDDFCGNCGTYLGWSSAAEETPAEEVGPVRPGAAPPAPAVAPREAQPGAVRPARPVAPRPVPTPPSGAVVVDGPPCPVCGTPNPPERRFCRHCAAPLNRAAAVAAPTGWRTRWPFRRRRRIGGSGGRIARRLFALLLVAALVVAGVVFLPVARTLVEDVRDKLGDAVAVVPERVTASAQVDGHPAASASDGLTNRYWGAAAVGDSVDFGFAAPFRLVALVVHTGASTEPEEFAAQGRATSVDLVVTASDGSATTRTVALADRPGPQTVDSGISDVVGIRLVVRAAAGQDPGRHVAIGEVEFFRRG